MDLVNKHLKFVHAPESIYMPCGSPTIEKCIAKILITNFVPANKLYIDMKNVIQR